MPVGQARLPQRAEDWIVQELRAGHPANFDLRALGYTDATAVLSATFMSSLMTNSRPDVKLDRHRLRIAHASIGRRVVAAAGAAAEFDVLDLANAEIPFDVTLQECQIGAVSAPGVILKRTLDLTGSTLRSLDLGLAQSQEDIILDRATVLGDLTMNTASVSGLLSTDHAVIYGNTSLNQATVKSGSYIAHTWFIGPIDAIDLATSYVDATLTKFADTSTNGRQFSRMHANSIARPKAQFASASDGQATDFSSVRVGGHFQLEKAMFSGPARFELADIVALDAGWAQFTDPNQALTLKE